MTKFKSEKFSSFKNASIIVWRHCNLLRLEMWLNFSTTFSAVVSVKFLMWKLIFNESISGFVLLQFDMKFEASSNLKSFSTVSHSDRFSSFFLLFIQFSNEIKNFSGFFQHHLVCQKRLSWTNWKIIYQKRCHEKKTEKGIEKRLNFVFLSSCHIKNDRIICHQNGTYNQPSIHSWSEWDFSVVFFLFLTPHIHELFEWKLNGTFICVIEKTKELKQSFIIESELKSCG